MTERTITETYTRQRIRTYDTVEIEMQFMTRDVVCDSKMTPRTVTTVARTERCQNKKQKTRRTFDSDTEFGVCVERRFVERDESHIIGFRNSTGRFQVPETQSETGIVIRP